MKNKVTGICNIRSDELQRSFRTLSEKTREFRFVHDLERFTAAAFELLLKDASVGIPASTSDIGIYLSTDSAVEDIKDKFFKEILDQGVLGASPLLFPFTSPNALAARASILFDIRGESITMPVRRPDSRAVEYADECISAGHVRMAIAGNIFKGDVGQGAYRAELYFLESQESAERRNIRTYEEMPEAHA